jgi:hypothetical protein
MAKQRDYGSRKFIITMTGMGLGAFVTLAAMFAEPDPAFYPALTGFYLLLGAGIGAYNWSNLRESQNGSAP